MAKPIPDIQGAANQQLRSLKKNVQGAKFSSKLSDAKNKQLVEEIVSEVLSELQGSDEFTLQLQNKITDIILGRITYSKAENDITQADLDELREEITKSLGDSDQLTDDIKQAASKCADLVVQSASPSGNPDEVINQIKDLTGKAEAKNKAPESPAEDVTGENIEKEQTEKQVSENIGNLKDSIDEEFKKSGNITDKVSSLVLAPVKFATTTVTAATFAVSFAVSTATKAISETFKSVNKAMSQAFNTVGNTFKAAKAAVTKTITAPFKFVGNLFGKINPFKGSRKKKVTKLEKSFFSRVEVIKKFIDNIDEFVVNFVKNNAKVLHKIFNKTLNNIINDMVDAVISKMKIVFATLAEGIGKIVESVVGAVVNGVIAPLLPVLYTIAAIILGIGVAIAVILMKFPEYAKPIIEVIPKIIDVFGQIVEFVMTKLWNFFKEELWPFFENKVWPFLRYQIWPFFTEKVFPIVEMIVDRIFNTIWPFVHETVWPWIADKLARIIDFLLTKVWPVVHDTLVWLRDEIITPVWEKFVIPLLKWLVDTIIPFIDKYVAPVLATILEILNIFLLALKPWIKPITTTILSILDWLLDLLYKVFSALEPVIITVAEVIRDVFVVVFESIDQIVSPILKWLQKQLIRLKELWNAFVETMTGFELLGCRPFAFLDGCKFDVGKPPSGANPPTPEQNEKSGGVSEFIQQLVNGIINATDIINDAVKALVFDQVKKKIKNIFKFLSSQKENEDAIDEEALNKTLTSNDTLNAIKTAIEKAENIVKKLSQIDNALAALVKDICKTKAEPEVDKTVKKTAETDGSTEVEAKKEEEKKEDAGFNVNEFITELFADTNDIQSANTEVADTIESTVSTAKENAMSFLKDTLMPMIESLQSPLSETIEILSKPPAENLEMNTIELNTNQYEPNQALSDQ